MKVRILPSSPDAGQLQHLISFVIDDRVAIDAGCIGLCGAVQAQAGLTSVLLTHSHLDHVASLPMFAMNVIDHAGRGVVVTAPDSVIASLRQDVFNGRVWPDFPATRLNGQPLVQFESVGLRQPTAVGGLTVTAIPLNHPVPTVGYLVDDGRSAVLFATDTGLTDEVWETAGRNSRLTTAFIDVAFPDELGARAEETGHLTPMRAREQAGRLPAAVNKIAVHLKPAYHARLVGELQEAAIPNLTIGRIGRDYEC
jgi:ribonuclease BN (tRNA processing enzyme)